MTWLQEVAAENKRNGGLPPIEVARVTTNVTSPVTSVTIEQWHALVTEVATLKARVALLEGKPVVPKVASLTQAGRDRAEYMRERRKRLASARNSPATAPDTTAPATTVDA